MDECKIEMIGGGAVQGPNEEPGEEPILEITGGMPIQVFMFEFKVNKATQDTDNALCTETAPDGSMRETRIYASWMQGNGMCLARLTGVKLISAKPEEGQQISEFIERMHRQSALLGRQPGAGPIAGPHMPI